MEANSLPGFDREKSIATWHPRAQQNNNPSAFLNSLLALISEEKEKGETKRGFHSHILSSTYVWQRELRPFFLLVCCLRAS